MPVVKEMDPYWYAKVEGRELETTTDTRPGPIPIESIKPVLIAFSLFILSIAMIYSWYWLAILGGLSTFGLFIIRSATDERKRIYREVESN